MGDRAVGLPPDFRAGAVVVGFRVVAVGELVEDLALAVALHLVGEVAGAFHALLLAHQDQFGAVGGHRRLALGGGVVRHDQDHPVTLDRRRHRQGDAGVAGSRLDQRVAGLDVAAQFGAGDHRKRRAILHRARGIVAFELHQQGVGSLPGDTLQAHQRGIADAVGDGRVLHGHGATRFRNDGGKATYDSGKLSYAIRKFRTKPIRMPTGRRPAANAGAGTARVRRARPRVRRPAGGWRCGRCSGRGRSPRRSARRTAG
ncbi:hypothetical protein D3C76_660360 [compost metagenome]